MSSPPAAIEPEGIFDHLRWSAILRGAVLDHVLSFIAMVPLALYIAGPEAFSEEDGVSSRALEQASVSPEFLLLSTVLGFAITSYAAFWAARRAGVFHLRHGGWTAVVSAILAAALILAPGAGEGPSAPFWYEVLIWVLILPAGLLGGWLASRVAGSSP